MDPVQNGPADSMAQYRMLETMVQEEEAIVASAASLTASSSNLLSRLDVSLSFALSSTRLLEFNILPTLQAMEDRRQGLLRKLATFETRP